MFLWILCPSWIMPLTKILSTILRHIWHLVSQLLYQTISWPDITFVVHKLSQFMAKSNLTHMNTTNHLLKYFKGIPGKGILLSKFQDFSIKVFAYVNWGSCPDTHCSITEFYVILENSLISWKLKKQQTTSKVIRRGRISSFDYHHMSNYMNL